EDCIGAVDVIAHSDTIKKLLLSPFNATQPLNMVVHRIGKTLLIDNCEYLRTTYPSGYNSSPVADFLKLKCSQRTGLTEMAKTPEKASKPMTGEESGFNDPLEDYGITGFQDADKVLFCSTFW
uniref:EDRF1 N-terminal domain-containing protein n=1 Tax=Parascaris equorum TaxID=6256 RepID=A0A914RCV0_PAREQ